MSVHPKQETIDTDPDQLYRDFHVVNHRKPRRHMSLLAIVRKTKNKSYTQVLATLSNNETGPRPINANEILRQAMRAQSWTT